MAASSNRQVEGLRRRGLAVDVAAFTEIKPKPDFRRVFREGGVDLHLSRTANEGLTARSAWLPVKQEHDRHPYTRVVGFGAGRAGYTAVTFAAWLDCPCLVLVRGNDFDQNWFDPDKAFRVRECLSRAAVIGAVSLDLVERIQALFRDRKVVYLPNGIDPDTVSLLPPDLALSRETRSHPALLNKAVIGLFGELKYKKGVVFWLRAIREAGLIERIGLLVVAKRLDEETEQILGDNTLSPEYLRLPFASRDRLPGLYAACDFIALPSLYEGLPNVLLETMAMGVIPIVSDAGAMSQLVRDGETGFIFPALDHQAAAGATARALDLDTDGRQKMAAACRDFIVKNFSWEKEIDGLVDVLDSGGR